MTPTIKFAAPGRWALYLGGCLLLAAALLLVGGAPLLLKKRDLTKIMPLLEGQLAKQQVLLPFQSQLNTALGGIPGSPGSRASRQPGPLTVSDIPDYLGRIAAMCGVPHAKFIPLPSSLDRPGQRLAVSASLRASPEAVRAFLVNLSLAEPFLNLQEVDASQPGNQLTANMIFWMHLPGADSESIQLQRPLEHSS